jgi:hypothetical protein
MRIVSLLLFFIPLCFITQEVKPLSRLKYVIGVEIPEEINTSLTTFVNQKLAPSVNQFFDEDKFISNEEKVHYIELIDLEGKFSSSFERQLQKNLSAVAQDMKQEKTFDSVDISFTGGIGLNIDEVLAPVDDKGNAVLSDILQSIASNSQQEAEVLRDLNQTVFEERDALISAKNALDKARKNLQRFKGFRREEEVAEDLHEAYSEYKEQKKFVKKLESSFKSKARAFSSYDQYFINQSQVQFSVQLGRIMLPIARRKKDSLADLFKGLSQDFQQQVVSNFTIPLRSLVLYRVTSAGSLYEDFELIGRYTIGTGFVKTLRSREVDTSQMINRLTDLDQHLGALSHALGR